MQQKYKKFWGKNIKNLNFVYRIDTDKILRKKEYIDIIHAYAKFHADKKNRIGAVTAKLSKTDFWK